MDRDGGGGGGGGGGGEGPDAFETAENVGGVVDDRLFFVGGGGGGGDLALNSFSVFGFAASLALSSATSMQRDAISSSLRERVSIVRDAMRAASVSASRLSSRDSSLELKRV
jgi:hypothetical protein